MCAGKPEEEFLLRDDVQAVLEEYEDMRVDAAAEAEAEAAAETARIARQTDLLTEAHRFARLMGRLLCCPPLARVPLAPSPCSLTRITRVRVCKHAHTHAYTHRA